MSTVTLPLWLFALLLALACWAALERLLVPSVRWFLRRRVNRVLQEVNTRLSIRIPSFQLTKRQVLIDRLLYDPQVLKAADENAQEREMPREVVMATVKSYAAEIVPAFNAYAYFRFGYWLAKRVAQLLYRVRLGALDQAALEKLKLESSTVVFLMNHRSNMDYILVSYLVAERTALSYAVGEWARIWPLQTLIRAMGAYFVRRTSRDALYRKVLERYVAMATAAGVPQAVYPEGGLTRDGRLRPPKLGLIDYMLRSFDPSGERDLVFIPVGINYDRTLEDRTLLAMESGRESGGSGSASKTLVFVLRNLVLMARNQWHRFGYACVNIGAPLSLRAHLAETGLDFRTLGQEERFSRVDDLAKRLMSAIGDVIPVLPVPLVATVFSAHPERAFSELELKGAVLTLMRRLEERGAQVYLPRGSDDYAVAVGLRMLTLRHMVEETDGLYRANPEEIAMLRYYANSIAHLGRASSES